MTYSLDKMPDAPYEFPPPPPFAVWVEDNAWDYRANKRVKKNGPKVGQIRHMHDLTKAKKRVRNYTTSNNVTFDLDWTVYLWDTEKGEYFAQYDGKAGEKVANNELFLLRVKKGDTEPRPGLDDEVANAIKSIVGGS